MQVRSLRAYRDTASRKRAAAELGIAMVTLDHHLTEAFAKLGVQSAIAAFRAMGWLTDGEPVASPGRPWLAIAVAVVAAFVGGFAAAVLFVSMVAAAEAPRPVQEPAPIPSTGTGFEQGSMPAAPGRTAAPSPDVATQPPPAPASQRADLGAIPPRAPRAVPAPLRVLRGRASWVRASLGPRYLAARLPKGTTLRVCGPLACFTGTVNDYGPSRRIFPGRIVDLSRARFDRVCGDPVILGTCRVRVEVLP